MFENFVESILDAENQAKEIVEKATVEASALILASQTDIEKINANANKLTKEKCEKLESECNEKLQSITNKVVETAKIQANDLKTEMLKKCEEKSKQISQELIKSWQ